MQPTTPRASGLGPLLLAFVAGAIGGAAGALVVQPRGTADGGADDAGLRQTVAALDESVRALSEQVGALGRDRLPADRPPTEPLHLPESGDQSIRNLVDVALVLGRLEEIAKLLQGRMAGATSGFGGASPLPLLDVSTTSGDRSALLPLATEENDQQQLWRRHAFWSCQQVLDAYGLPDQIEAGDGTLGFYYETGGRMLHFMFYEGMLVNLWN